MQLLLAEYISNQHACRSTQKGTRMHARTHARTHTHTHPHTHTYTYIHVLMKFPPTNAAFSCSLFPLAALNLMTWMGLSSSSNWLVISTLVQVTTIGARMLPPWPYTIISSPFCGNGSPDTLTLSVALVAMSMSSTAAKLNAKALRTGIPEGKSWLKDWLKDWLKNL